MTQGSATTIIVDPDGGSSDPVNLPVGSYHVYVMVNSNNTFDSSSNEPTFGAGDHGFYRAVQVGGGAVTYLTLNESESVPLIPLNVLATIPDDVDTSSDAAKSASMQCIFSPPGSFVGTQLPIPNPTQVGGPIVGVSTRYCASDCEVDRAYVTNKPTYLPVPLNSLFDLSCFVDLNDSDGRDSGDLVFTGVVGANQMYSIISVPLSVSP